MSVVRAYVFCPQTHYINPSTQISTHDVEDVFESLIFHDQDRTLDDL
jgi:hypothetical protein